MNVQFIIRAVFLFVTTYVFFPTYAQQGDTLFVMRGESGKITFAQFMADENSDRKMHKDTSFLKSVLQAKKQDEFQLVKVETDDMGITHKRFKQYYKGIKVDNAEYLIHGKDNNIEYINGDFTVINLPSIYPMINEQEALNKALEYVNAEMYKWQDPNMEEFVKKRFENPNATYYPKGELVIAKDYLRKSDLHKLSWKFTISSLQPVDEKIVIVDAINGEIIQDVPLIINTFTSGTAQTMYSGVNNIICDSYSGGYRLYESRSTTSGQSVFINTANCLNGTNYAAACEFSNKNTNWTSGSWSTFNQNQAALDVHWGTEKILDYWSNVHNRNSIDNSGLQIISYVHYHKGYINASWDSNVNAMRFGDGSGLISPFTALDIIAHEMGHGIIQFTSALYYGYTESGASNEGFCDIWGACVKNYTDPSKATWLLGGEVFQTPSYNCIRDMQNPKNSLAYEGCHPSKYKGQ